MSARTSSPTSSTAMPPWLRRRPSSGCSLDAGVRPPPSTSMAALSSQGLPMALRRCVCVCVCVRVSSCVYRCACACLRVYVCVMRVLQHRKCDSRNHRVQHRSLSLGFPQNGNVANPKRDSHYTESLVTDRLVLVSRQNANRPPRSSPSTLHNDIAYRSLSLGSPTKRKCSQSLKYNAHCTH